MGNGIVVRVAVTVKAVQLVVGVVVIEGAGDVLCARLLGECAVCNVHNGRAFAAFGIADSVFLAPVAVTENPVLGYVTISPGVCCWVAIIGKKAGCFQVRGNFRCAILLC